MVMQVVVRSSHKLFLLCPVNESVGTTQQQLYVQEEMMFSINVAMLKQTVYRPLDLQYLIRLIKVHKKLNKQIDEIN